jgi:2-aminoadipate transaminase
MFAFSTFTHVKDYNGGRFVSNGTFSKILAPGIRLGWIEAGTRIRDQIRNSGILSSGGALNNVMSGFVSSALELGLQEAHVQDLRETYKHRTRSAKVALERGLPPNFQCNIPGGGYFLWVTGPQDFDAKKFALYCKDEYSVQVLPGVTCSPCTVQELICHNAFRLSIAFYQEPELVKGINQVCLALQQFIK